MLLRFILKTRAIKAPNLWFQSQGSFKNSSFTTSCSKIQWTSSFREAISWNKKVVYLFLKSTTIRKDYCWFVRCQGSNRRLIWMVSGKYLDECSTKTTTFFLLPINRYYGKCNSHLILFAIFLGKFEAFANRSHAFPHENTVNY